MAAQFCHAIGARHMILTHFSQRYKSLDDIYELSTVKLRQEAIEELKRLQPDSNVVVDCADDFKVFDIKSLK